MSQIIVDLNGNKIWIDLLKILSKTFIQSVYSEHREYAKKPKQFWLRSNVHVIHTDRRGVISIQEK